MNVESYQLKTFNETKLAVLVYPHQNPKGIVQVIHGALEYKERYQDFAEFLNQAGYVVLLSDNRGHGESISKADPFGVMKDFQQLVSDQIALSQFIKEKYPNIPLVLFGHSFGSIIARNYLQEQDQQLKGLILTGTANYNMMVPWAVKIGQKYVDHFGFFKGNRLLNYLSGNLGSEHDWLSNNPENNQKAKEDQKMVPFYPVSSLLAIWQGDLQLKDYPRYRCQNPKLAIYNLVGAEDHKITGGKKGLADTVKTLKKIGYQNVITEELAGMKHEVLMEIEKQKVYEKILAFLAKIA